MGSDSCQHQPTAVGVPQVGFGKPAAASLQLSWPRLGITADTWSCVDDDCVSCRRAAAVQGSSGSPSTKRPAVVWHRCHAFVVRGLPLGFLTARKGLA